MPLQPSTRGPLRALALAVTAVLAATSFTTPTASAATSSSKLPASSPSLRTDPYMMLRDAGVDAHDMVRVTSIDHDGSVRVNKVGAADAPKVIASLQARSRTAAVAIDHRVHARANSFEYCSTAQTEQSFTAAADDELSSLQWGLASVRADEAWAIATGNGAVVAVVDTGVDASHPDLAGSVLDGIDYIDSSEVGTTDPGQHGTHVAAIIAAHRGDGGMVGLAPDAKILPVRVLDADGSGWESDVAAGIIWAVDNGADVVNLSLGGGYDAVSVAATQYAVAHGAIVVAASGNERLDDENAVSWPAVDDSTIAVAATCPDDTSALFSNMGSYVDIAAPGTSILSAVPDAGYEVWDGTSMATPFVAAAAALVISAHSDWTNAQVRYALLNGARVSGAPANEVGAGTLDAAAALGIDAPADAVNPTTTTPALVNFDDIVVSLPAGTTKLVDVAKYVTNPDETVPLFSTDCGTVDSEPSVGAICLSDWQYANPYVRSLPLTGRAIVEVVPGTTKLRITALRGTRGILSTNIHYFSGFDGDGTEITQHLSAKLDITVNNPVVPKYNLRLARTKSWSYSKDYVSVKAVATTLSGAARPGVVVKARYVSWGRSHTLSATTNRYGVAYFKLRPEYETLLVAYSSGVLNTGVTLAVSPRPTVSVSGSTATLSANAFCSGRVEQYSDGEWVPVESFDLEPNTGYDIELEPGQYRLVLYSYDLRTITKGFTIS